ncbi:MAG: N-acyl homoserine lactonase family protein [Chloroflexota bacterium]
MMLLVQQDGKNILIDTGVPPAAAGDPGGLSRAFDLDPAWIKPLVGPHERVDAQLELLGLRTSELDMVVNTHLHFDHAGGNPLLRDVPLWVQDAELESVADSEDPAFWDGPFVTFRNVRGDWSPVSGVDMLLTPGHTPGHQSVLIHSPGQDWLFTWDAVYTEEHWREDKLGAVVDVTAARSSLRRLRRLAERPNTRCVFGHDLAQWTALGLTGPEPVVLIDS